MFQRLTSTPEDSKDESLAHSLAKLWPHREHEANAVKNLYCLLGFHSWRQLNLEEQALNKEVRYLLLVFKIKIDAIIYNGR